MTKKKIRLQIVEIPMGRVKCPLHGSKKLVKCTKYGSCECEQCLKDILDYFKSKKDKI